MATKIVFVTSDPNRVDEDAAIITRKDLNLLLEEGWEIQEETVSSKKEPSKVVLRKTDQALSVPTHRHPTVQSNADPAQQMVAAFQGIERALSSGGSHLGGSVTRAIPGVQLVSAQEVGMARDAGVHAAMMGWAEDSCPWPPQSRPWGLWMEGYRMGSTTLDQQVDTDPSDYNEDQKLAYNQGQEEALADRPEAYCPYRGGPLYLAWLRGFTDHGGKIE